MAGVKAHDNVGLPRSVYNRTRARGNDFFIDSRGAICALCAPEKGDLAPDAREYRGDPTSDAFHLREAASEWWGWLMAWRIGLRESQEAYAALRKALT